QSGPFDPCLRIDDGALPYPHTIGDLEARHLDLYQAVEGILLCFPVRVDVPDVGPIAVGDIPEDRRTFLEHPWEGVFREVVRLAFRDQVEDLRLEHIDAGVDGIGENLTPARLFEEAIDPALL